MFKDYKRRDFVVDYINEFLVELEYAIDILLSVGCNKVNVSYSQTGLRTVLYVSLIMQSLRSLHFLNSY